MKIMAIDDEIIVTTGLRVLLPWEEYGFEWLPPAENGAQALEQMKLARPDVILVDCRMPVMGGLELLTEIHKRQWPIKSVILSGHDEFDYARQALQLGASDYLLKPPDTDKLRTVMMKLKAEWEQENRHNRQQKENLPVLRERFVRSLLEGAKVSEPLFAEKTSSLGVPLSLQPFRVILLQIGQDPEAPRLYPYDGEQLMKFAIENIIDETLRHWEQKCMIWDQPDRVAVIAQIPGSIDALRGDLLQTAANIRQTLRYIVTAGVGAACERLAKDGKAAYDQAKTALEYQYYTGPGEVIFIEEIDWETSAKTAQGQSAGRAPDELYASAAHERLCMALKIGNDLELEAWLQSFFAGFHEREMPVQLTKTESLQAMMSAANVIAELHPKLQPGQLLTSAHIQSVFTAATLETLHGICGSFLRELLKLTVDMRKSGKHHVIEAAKAILDTRYDSNLSLESVAREVYVSPVYLSFLFKQVEGVNVTDYVTHVRIEKAKQLLLATNLKTYEIASRIGYQDEKYFSRLFKKKVGLTPSVFRQQG
ncbi:response regulator transcription factor [Paenibacillus contaminans]|uniref:DNA-binding response regulator n=1 Tax=Paenibacillus contaminans TaxID=450362 RepID=A0A329MAH7_9BACL|nr:response regulator [Paenibacillus contaminans]RAV16126.1 hypothetical protein DQG23_29505 [Paenibacillus contaminans]